MTESKSKSELFAAMGLGPVWELKNAPVSAAQLPSTAPVHGQENPSMDTLRDTVAECRRCGLCETRTQTVFADGVPNAHLMVIGEAPGADEDASGLPFVGRAGQLLDRMLNAVGADRKKNVYIANVLKCRPPGNRNPESHEIDQCSPYLHQQIEAVQPRLILLVGKFAIQTMLNNKKPVGELRGVVHGIELHGLNIPAVATYHPAYLLRRPEEKAKAWDDLLLLKKQGV